MTNDWPLYNQAAASIPFTLKGYKGSVAVYYGVNDDPAKVGFDALPGLNFDIALSRGYPVIHARIEQYAGSGYRMLCGWIQIITSVYRDSHDDQIAQTHTFVSTDVAPAFSELDMPFANFGYLPQLFDAPCYNLGPYAALTWTADTFLTTIPLRSKNEPIERLLGFRWGYTENNLPDQTPVLLPLEVTAADVWNNHLPHLRMEYSGWKFKAA
ncbi:MAG: hypothetical protein WHX52_11765 [Anaerolineae bacterium]